AFLTSPTFGAISWLAHATLQSGLWVDSQPRYDLLVTSPRLTLSRLFQRAGSRTPRMIDQSAVGDGSVYDGMPEQLPSEGDIWPSPERVKAAYGDSIEYSLESLVSFVTHYGDDDLV